MTPAMGRGLLYFQAALEKLARYQENGDGKPLEVEQLRNAVWAEVSKYSLDGDDK